MSIPATTGRAGRTLREWAKKADLVSGMRAGMPREGADPTKARERENSELRQAPATLVLELLQPLLLRRQQAVMRLLPVEV